MLKPDSPHTVRFTVDDLERMIGAGVFDDRTGRIELIEGEFSQMMSPASEYHDKLIRLLTTWSVQQQTESQFEVAVQMGLRLNQTDSMPEPDLYWVQSGYNARAVTAVVPLVIEVALSSVRYDREEKARLYALDSLQEYWVVDAEARAIEVRTQPNGEQFDRIEVFGQGKSLSPICMASATLEVDWLFRSADATR